MVRIGIDRKKMTHIHRNFRLKNRNTMIYIHSSEEYNDVCIFDLRDDKMSIQK